VVAVPPTRKYPRIAPKTSSAIMFVRLIAIADFGLEFAN
jgi:hypothetical protein